MSKKLIVILLLIATLIGGFARFAKLGQIPGELNVDEVSIGYNAYSILKTGSDEYGVKMPLTFRSLGDYKAPLYIYLTVISVSIFGLNPFAVRFPSAFFGTLLIPLIYFLIRSFSKNGKVSIAAAFLLSVSPWGIYFSRVASEAMVATFFLVLGILTFLKSGKSALLLIISALFLSLSMYTYHSEKLFVPVFSLVLIFYTYKTTYKKGIVVFLFSLVIFSLPLLYVTFFGLSAIRAGMTFITKDVDFARMVYMEPISTTNIIFNIVSSKWVLMFFYWIRKYLAYFTPSFLFYNSLYMTEASYGLGVMNMFEIPTFIVGIWLFIKDKPEYFWLLTLWVFMGLIPASLTINELHPIRTLIILPLLIFFSATGIVWLIEYLKKIKNRLIKNIVFLGCFIFILWCLVYSFMTFGVHHMYQRGEYFMLGTRDAVMYALDNYDKYDEIVFDPIRGIKAPNVVSTPHLYILFYSKFDPTRYHQEAVEGPGYLKFDKFVVREIKWGEDVKNKNTMLIGSPWNIPVDQLEENEVLKKIYIGHDDLAYVIASPL